MKKVFPASQLIINEDGSAFHLHIRPEHLADKVILVGDQGRVDMVASFFDEGSIECDIQSREFHTITGKYKGKRISCISTGIGTDNCDIVLNELDALANIDFTTRTEKDEHRTLEIVRIGITFLVVNLRQKYRFCFFVCLYILDRGINPERQAA